MGKFTPSPMPVLRINNNDIEDSKEVSNILAKHFASVSKKNVNSPYHQQRIQQEQQNINFKTRRTESYNLPFLQKEFVSALSNCNDSSPGPDDIPYAMIKKTNEETKGFILAIINRIWKESSFPSAWEMAFILPFAKPGKDGTIPSSYRPIALTSCICKLMEKMVNVRLMWYLERNGLISPAQCGFRQMRSCTDILIRLEDSICTAFATKHHHITVFFDLEKAYDMTWRHGILKTLHECGLRGELPLFIKSFLKNRKFQVKVGNTMSNTEIQEEGVPQGSVLSVTLFALAINGISKVIPDDMVHSLFVDDLSISISSSRMPTAERRMQLAIDKVVEWADKQGFRFSTSKTVVVHFCRIRGIHPDPDIYICTDKEFHVWKKQNS